MSELTSKELTERLRDAEFIAEKASLSHTARLCVEAAEEIKRLRKQHDDDQRLIGWQEQHDPRRRVAITSHEPRAESIERGPRNDVGHGRPAVAADLPVNLGPDATRPSPPLNGHPQNLEGAALAAVLAARPLAWNEAEWHHYADKVWTAIRSAMPQRPDTESLIAEFEQACRVDDRHTDKYTVQEVRDTREALLAAMRPAPPPFDALALLREVHAALTLAWNEGRLPHDVISADLAQRCSTATKGEGQ